MISSIEEKEIFNKWAESHDHNILTSFPKSGRNYLGDLIRRISNLPVINGILPAPGVSYDDIHLYVAHRGIWKIRNNHGNYILLLRDPRDAILSRVYTCLLVETDKTIEHFMKDTEWILSNIKEWLMYFTIFIPYNPLIIQYEHLCLSPFDTLQSIFEFINLPQERDIVSVITEYDLTKPDPLKANDLIPHSFPTGYDRYIDHCLKWQKDPSITPVFLETIWNEAKEIMKQYGYTENGHSLHI